MGKNAMARELKPAVENASTTALAQFDQAADQLNLDCGTREVLRACKRVTCTMKLGDAVVPRGGGRGIKIGGSEGRLAGAGRAAPSQPGEATATTGVTLHGPRGPIQR